MRPNLARLGLLLSLIGVTLACAGPQDAPADITPAPAAPPAPSGPPVLGVIQQFQMEGAGCGCTSPTGIGSSYLSDGQAIVMSIDGVERHLTRVSEGTQGENRKERLAADGYTVDMVWKQVAELEGGASYDVKVNITQGERPPLKATLSCGCGC
jgi:hypothetical protein